MSLFAFGSAKASPGVTTAVLALAAVWPPDRQVVVVELDPDGGDVAAWWDLAAQPGLLSYAAAGRRDLRPDTILAHTQPLPGLGRVEVVAGPASPEQAEAALTTLLAAGLGEGLDALAEVDVLIDCGRLRPGSPLVGLLNSIALLLLVGRPTLAEVAHLRPRVAALRSRRPALLLIGDQPYGAEEVTAALDVSVLGVLAHDPRGAATLGGRREASRGLARSKLVRSAVPVAQHLADLIGWNGAEAFGEAAVASDGGRDGQVAGRR